MKGSKYFQVVHLIPIAPDNPSKILHPPPRSSSFHLYWVETFAIDTHGELPIPF